ncbi:trypsin-like peptidase domain-containing protein [Enterococcus termitis]
MSYGYNGTVNQVTFSKSSGNMVSTSQPKWFGWLYESSDIQIVGGMSGGPVMNASNEVIGINSNTGNGVSRFVKMQPRIADSFFK